MEVIHSIEEMRNKAAAQRALGQTVGFVPTMGFLHDGHLSLVRRAAAENDFVVVSTFVNPLQFGRDEDFNEYPRDLRRDAKMAESAGANCVFAPSEEEMYPEGFCATVSMERLSGILCGKHRPGHFNGVTTVVAKLFNIITPNAAYFGEKDAQQLMIIRSMVADLNYPIKIVGCPTARESDNLAMSSRNILLAQDERTQAAAIAAALFEAREMVENGERDAEAIVKRVRARLEEQPLCQVDYVDALNAATFDRVLEINGKTLIAVAARFGSTRLIDNIMVG